VEYKELQVLRAIAKLNESFELVEESDNAYVHIVGVIHTSDEIYQTEIIIQVNSGNIQIVTALAPMHIKEFGIILASRLNKILLDKFYIEFGEVDAEDYLVCETLLPLLPLSYVSKAPKVIFNILNHHGNIYANIQDLMKYMEGKLVTEKEFSYYENLIETYFLNMKLQLA
jgi:hypothetical protein